VLLLLLVFDQTCSAHLEVVVLAEDLHFPLRVVAAEYHVGLLVNAVFLACWNIVEQV
jgi:hypothetical protein